MSSKTILARELGVSRGCLYYRPKQPDKDWKTKCAIELALRDNPIYGHNLSALNAQRRPVIFHSDNGKEYDAKDFKTILQTLCVQISRSKKGCPWENGYQESFYDKFKVDLGDPNRFGSLGELVSAIYETIHYYNYRRIHTVLKMPPMEFALRSQNQIEYQSRTSV